MDARLLVSFVIDNSAAVQGERFSQLKAALTTFWNKIKESNVKNIEFEFITFDEFEPIILKSFANEELKLDNFNVFKMPFLGKSIDLAVDSLMNRYSYYEKKEIPVYKPWLFLLSDAYTFDDLTDCVNKLKEYINSSKVLYMPFVLSTRKLPQNFEPLVQAKRFMRIKDNNYDGFFDWLYKMSTKRATTPNGVGVKFDRADFEGWAIL